MKTFYALEQINNPYLYGVGYCLNIYTIDEAGKIKKYGTVLKGIYNPWHWEDFQRRVVKHGFIVGKPTRKKLSSLTDLQRSNLFLPAY
jgi:hypothetical protein